MTGRVKDFQPANRMRVILPSLPIGVTGYNFYRRGSVVVWPWWAPSWLRERLVLFGLAWLYRRIPKRLEERYEFFFSIEHPDGWRT